MTTLRAQPLHAKCAIPTRPSIADVQVWSWRTATGVHSRADLEILDNAELTRVHQFKSANAASEYISCRATVRRLLARRFHVPVGEISLGRNPCPGCGSAEHGPPALLSPATPCHISISHCTGLAMLAVAPFPVGVDAEAVRDVPVADISGNVLTPQEHRAVFAEPAGPARTRAFLRCWTRKEAVLKAVGIGIATDLTALETRAWAAGPAEVTTDALSTDALSTPTSWWVTDAPVPDGWTAAMALPSDAGRNVTVQHL